jgi:hypothetical protein
MAFVFSQFVMSVTSFRRIGAFLETQELPSAGLTRSDEDGTTSASMQSDASIMFSGASFHWGSAPMPDGSQPEIKRVPIAMGGEVIVTHPCIFL